MSLIQNWRDEEGNIDNRGQTIEIHSYTRAIESNKNYIHSASRERIEEEKKIAYYNPIAIYEYVYANANYEVWRLAAIA